LKGKQRDELLAAQKQINKIQTDIEERLRMTDPNPRPQIPAVIATGEKTMVKQRRIL